MEQTNNTLALNTAESNASVCDLVESYAISESQSADYQKNGHILLRQVISAPEIAYFRPIISVAADRFNTETRPLEERDTYGKAFLQIMNLWERDDEVRRFTLARRFGKIAADLMGVAGVRLYHDQALFKEAGGGPTPWHQDQYYWPLDTNNTITMWMPLVDIPEEIGSMTFGSGSQMLGYVGDLAISDESDRALSELIEHKGIVKHKDGAMKAGDATFHSGWTLHSAPGNPTTAMREVMTIIYFADGTLVGEPDTPNRKSDLARWLPGLQAGSLAASDLNPIVYSR